LIQVLDVSLIDEVITVTDEVPTPPTGLLAKEKGLVVGTLSGTNMRALMKLATRLDKNIVTVLADRAEGYSSKSLI
jgi:cysteine synthase